MKKGSKLLLALAACLALGNCYNKQNVIVVSKTPRGAYAGEEMPHNIGWYEIGLSRNGKEPIEYMWHADVESHNHTAIMNAEIGSKGTIHLSELAKRNKTKLPRPNAKNPPVIGLFEHVTWEKRE
jgi:hypothetical protein